MKSLFISTAFVLLMSVFPTAKTEAQFDIGSVISAGVKKVINAVDLSIQRMQNETIWLQNAQKQIENVLSQTKLTDISDWTQKQKDLYAGYFDELWKVKDAIALYHRIKEITQKQLALTGEYKHALSLFRQDTHFTPNEIEYMSKVYTGILNESLNNLDQLFLVINSFTTQMSDEQRMQLIDAAGNAIDNNYNDLQQFTNQNKILSLQRSKDANEIATVKALYGLQ
ncbi:conjugal transfer protein TraI [Ilyomonas limi]|uniref:Conjugal transfer protein TraI n=1 Tax=Ilyomonas limi TaxID=2575867 RepID=A0A4U3KR56_9BACT|nr:conjugal transfer protein TraI [Ilyomonas limi]TKK64712.1 conjugal transfer protein TraI [Ilyomonas limi]